MAGLEQEQAAERKVKMRRVLTGFALLLVLSGVAYGVYSVTLGRQYLEGETTLDFGLIEYDTFGAKVSGQFDLVNSLSSPLTIVAVKPSCGCTTVEPGPWTLAPGEQWTLPVDFEISKTGLKEADIKVVMEGDRVQTLYVRGIGRDTRMLTSSQANGFTLRPALPSLISIRASIYDDTEPPELVAAEMPENVSVRVVGWEQSRVQRIGKYEPILWSTQIEVRQDGGEPIRNGSITFAAKGTDQSITLPINADIPGAVVNDGPGGSGEAVVPENPAESAAEDR